tara:strand:+ start:411 stop:809 length:399 start_codon:yes stop_codon:yes gene_type:complete
MRKTYLYIALGLGVAGIGFLAYKNLRRKRIKSNIGEQDFPLYPNPLCNDDIEGGCPFDARVLEVQEFLNQENMGMGISIAEDGLFGTDTANAIQTYMEMWANTSESTLYLDWGYNYVEIPNYITLAFYQSIS